MSPPKPKPISNNKPTNFPDFLFTSLSLLFLFASSPSKPNHFCKIPFLPLPFNPRRFLKTHSMSHNFSSPQSLSDWLKPRLPSDSFSSWGIKPGTKNVHNLWLELSEGETSLADSIPPIRTVNVVTVTILRDEKILVESHQELSDGSVRDRWRPLSEKMKPNESVDDAVLRAITEELGSVVSDLNRVRIVPDSYKERVEERNSVSYPGLPACYVLHSVDVVIDGLPDGEFCTEEEGEEYNESESAEKAVYVKRHFWKWVSPDSVRS